MAYILVEIGVICTKKWNIISKCKIRTKQSNLARCMKMDYIELLFFDALYCLRGEEHTCEVIVIEQSFNCRESNDIWSLFSISNTGCRSKYYYLMATLFEFNAKTLDGVRDAIEARKI